ncbi:MAG: uroporphyrinogen decarboxylase [Planctomycetes bacterium]|nr:uroporphyrinogen decarboxylase [Planctomycetota bacterium]
MTRHERLSAILAGRPADRPAVSFWRHFYPEEVTPGGLADAMLAFQREFDWDFVKVNPRASYHAEDWGNTYDFSHTPGVNHALKSWRVHRPEDWLGLEPLRPDRGVLGQHLEALAQIEKGLRSERVPLIMTVFNPLSIAGHLAGGPARLVGHLRERPDRVHAGLETITETFTRFARACLERGAYGLFFPTTLYASAEVMSPAEYAEFGRPYDLRLLESVQDAPFLLLHVCKSRCFVLELLDYPVHAVNWSAHDPTNPGLAEVAARTARALVGGVDQGETLSRPDGAAALGQARSACSVMRGRPFMLGPGCTMVQDASRQTLHALRRMVS